MLIMTPKAAAAIRALADRQKASDRAGLRIAEGEAGKFTAILVMGPAAGDQLIEDTGARLFVAPETAALVADLTLDADIDPEGGVVFALHES